MLSSLCVLTLRVFSSSILPASRAAFPKMHKLNGERLKPPTEPAQPGNYLLYHGQQLNDHADYFAEAAHMGSGCQPGFEGEVPESPMTKQLREEQKRQNISEQQSAGASAGRSQGTQTAFERWQRCRGTWLRSTSTTIEQSTNSLCSRVYNILLCSNEEDDWLRPK